MREYEEIKAPRGKKLNARGWQQEAALRLLMNNLDPEVAKDPENLIVYGGKGKAARTWKDFDEIVAMLKELYNDETLLIQSGKTGWCIQDNQGSAASINCKCPDSPKVGYG